jgi:hypothetical protein
MLATTAAWVDHLDKRTQISTAETINRLDLQHALPENAAKRLIGLGKIRTHKSCQERKQSAMEIYKITSKIVSRESNQL